MLELIRSRRVVRVMTDEPVAREDLERILDAGRWAPVGGNLRTVRFVAVQDPVTLRLLRMVSPGMFQRPKAAIVLCLDLDVLGASRVTATDPTPLLDIGTTLQTMLLAAHALGLGAGPVSSCAWAAVREVLVLPPSLEPRMIVCIGHAAPPQAQLPMRAAKVTWRDLTHWERFGRRPEGDPPWEGPADG